MLIENDARGTAIGWVSLVALAAMTLSLSASGRDWLLTGGSNSLGLNAATWKDSDSDQTTNQLSAADRYYVQNKFIYVSSASPTLNTFTGKSLCIGEAGNAKLNKSALYQYGGARAYDIPGDAVFENEGLILASGYWRLRYQGRNYYADGRVTVTATDDLPFVICDEGTRANCADTLTLLTALAGSGSLLVSAGTSGANTNLVLALACDTSEFTGSLTLQSTVHETAGWLCRAGLELGSRELPGVVEIGAESFVSPQTATNRMQIGNLVLRADSRLLFKTVASRSSGKRRIDCAEYVVTQTLTAEPGVRLVVEKPDAICGVVPDELRLLTVPQTCPLDSDDFRVDFGDDALAASELFVRENLEDGTKSLVVRCLRATDAFVEETVNKIDLAGTDWTDGLAPHANTHYRVAPTAVISEATATVPSASSTETEYAFPGASLTLGRKTSAYRGILNLSTETFQLPLLALVGRTHVNCLTGCEIQGDIWMDSSAQTVVEVWKSDRFVVSGNLSGSGTLTFRGRGQGSSNPGGFVAFAGDNSDYAGCLDFTMLAGNGGLTPSATVDIYGRRHFTTAFVERSSDLGGALAETTTNAVRVGEYSQLVVGATQRWDEPTRGFLIAGVGRFNVTNAADTLFFAAPLTLAGSLWKEGPGTLVLSNAAPVVATANPELVIKSGTVRCQHAHAVDGVKVIFAGTDAKLVYEADPQDEQLARYGLVNLSSNDVPFAVADEATGIPVAAEWTRVPELREKRVALMTVRAEFAEELAALIRLETQTGLQARVVSIVRQPVVVDGIACETLLARVDSHDVIIRSQFKYGLERSDYIHKWYDRPLLQDTTYQAFNERGHSINVESWKRHAELGRLCGHGFAAFIATSGRADIINRSVIPGAESVILTEMSGDTSFEGGSTGKVDTCIWVAEQALAMTNSYRIGGKIILTSYPAVKVDQLGFYTEVKRILDERYPGQFAVMPYFNPYSGSLSDLTNQTTVATIAENIRTLLRTVDGLCLSASSMVFTDRRSYPENFLTYVAPAIRAVLDEPEFAGRPFGLLGSLGHENCYRWNYVYDCTGTKVFRDCLKIAQALKPDFVLGAEWDEENENTHHRPTIATGLTHQRLLRYATAVLNGLPPSVYPADDTTIPNLVVSYRKGLMAGEPIEVEVLNIPDGTFAGATFDVSLNWRTTAGAVVKTYAAQQLGADELAACWFRSPATELINEAALWPELVVRAGEREWTFAEQLWPIELHVNRQLDFRWRKQPLRDVPFGVTGALAVGDPAADGTVLVSGSVSSPEELRSIEVQEGPDTVFMYEPTNAYPDASGDLRVRIVWQSSGANPTETLTGEIRRRSAGGTRVLRTFKNASCSSSLQALLVTVPAAEIDTTFFEVDLPTYFTGEVSAAEIKSRGAKSFAAAGGMNLLFRRWLVPESMPPPCRVKEATFAFRLKPSVPDAVLRLQTVDQKYRIGLPAVRTLGRLRHRTVRTTFYERASATVSDIDVDLGRCVTAKYAFDPQNGAILSSGAGFAWDGLLCGNAATLAGFGGGEGGGYGSPMYEYGITTNSIGWPKTAPQYVTEADGKAALEFKDASYAVLPMQVVPTYAQFVLDMEVKPEDVTAKQGLVSSGPHYFTLWIEAGRVWASVFQRNLYFSQNGRATCKVQGPEIVANAWQRIRVTYDRRTFRVDVDDRQGTPAAVSGDLMYSRPMALGTLGGDGFFQGRIRQFSVTPYLPDDPTPTVYLLRD